MNTKFIHIGHHRCGSTFLQKEVFPRLKGITPVTYEQNHGTLDAINCLCLCADLYYDAEWVTSTISEKLGDMGPIGVSFEGFTGLNQGLAFGYQLSFLPRRLMDVFGPTKILLVVRNQKGHLLSRYRTRIRYGMLADFESWIRSWHVDQRLNFLKYSRLVDAYAEVFGRDNIHIVLFEELFRTETIAGILEAFDVPADGVEEIPFTRRVNESDTTPVFALTKLVNRLFGSKLTYSATVGKQSKLRMYNWWRYRGAPPLNRLTYKMGCRPPSLDFEGFDDLLRDLYHEDNQRLAEIMGRDLSPFGYV